MSKFAPVTPTATFAKMPLLAANEGDDANTSIALVPVSLLVIDRAPLLTSEPATKTSKGHNFKPSTNVEFKPQLAKTHCPVIFKEETVGCINKTVAGHPSCCSKSRANENSDHCREVALMPLIPEKNALFEGA